MGTGVAGPPDPIPPPVMVASEMPIEMATPLRSSNTVNALATEVKLLWVGKPFIMLLAIPITVPAEVAVKPELPPIETPVESTLAGSTE